MPQKTIRARAGDSVNLIYQSPGQQVIYCQWERDINGTEQLNEKANGGTSVDGVDYSGDKCTLRISSVERVDFTSWNCTMVTSDSQILRQIVNLVDAEGMRIT